MKTNKKTTMTSYHIRERVQIGDTSYIVNQICYAILIQVIKPDSMIRVDSLSPDS